MPRRVLLAFALGLCSGAFAAPLTCGEPVQAPAAIAPLPAAVTGRVAFYAALYDPRTLTVRRELTLGDTSELHPLASLFKPLVVEGVLRDVDRGALALNTPLTTTAANRSIEAYPAGTHSLRDLARRALVQSDNTASDLLQLTYGAGRLAREVRGRSPCTSVLLTTKAWWGAQAGLASSVLGPDLSSGAQRYADQPFEARVQTASALIAASRSVTGPQVEAGLDAYFHGPGYTPDLELALQNTSTAKAYTDLMARTLPGVTLQPKTRAVFREALSHGCCTPKAPLPGQHFWAAKAGSGWRLLNLTGVVETNAGLLAYTYLNDGSNTQDAEDLERQIPALVRWIAAGLRELLGGE